MSPFTNMFGALKEEAQLKNALGLMGTPTVADSGLVARRRFTVAEINAGATLLPAIFGFHYRIHDMVMIAIGGATSGATDIRILATQAGAAIAALIVAVAALTQSSVVRAGAANATVLADGASFNDLDSNTAVTVGKTGGSAATSTNIDVMVIFDLIADQ